MDTYFDKIWYDISKNNILGYDDTKLLFEILLSCPKDGETAEIGVYKGKTSRMIMMATEAYKNHYAYDTFSGIIDSREGMDGPLNGEYKASVGEFMKTIGSTFSQRVILKNGNWRERINDESTLFSFVYVDTGTYESTKGLLNCMIPRMMDGGKIVFYSGSNCYGVKQAIDEECNSIENKGPFSVFSKI